MPNTPANRKDAGKKDGIKNQVKFLDLKKKSESDYLLFDGKIVLISYNSQMPFALVIEEREMAENFRVQFENLWQRL